MFSKIKFVFPDLKINEFTKDCNNEIKKIYEALEDNEIVPFYMIFKLMKFLYKNSKTDDERKNIISKYIMDEDISNDYLNKLIINNKNNIPTFDSMYSLLKFSLSKDEKLKFLNYTSEQIKNDENEIWFVNCDILNEFNNIIIFIGENINNKKKEKKIILNNIDNKIK